MAQLFTESGGPAGGVRGRMSNVLQGRYLNVEFIANTSVLGVILREPSGKVEEEVEYMELRRVPEGAVNEGVPGTGDGLRQERRVRKG